MAWQRQINIELPLLVDTKTVVILLQAIPPLATCEDGGVYPRRSLVKKTIQYY